ncbi:MAG: M15 family metallopeptidase [Candidatus Saccharimonadales bacterium]
MANQQFYQPPNFRRDDSDHQVYGDAPLGGDQQGQAASGAAQQSVDDIDSLLDEVATGETNPGTLGTSPNTSTRDSTEASPAAELNKAENEFTGPDGMRDEGTGRLSAAKRMGRLLTGKKGIAAISGGGGIVAMIVGTTFLLSLLAPLKINVIVSRLESLFFATSTDAVSQTSDNLMSGYIKKHVIAGIKKGHCTKTTSSNCVAPISGTSPINKLYDGWRQSRIETKLATDYNIEFGKDSSGRLYMKAPGLATNGMTLPSDFDTSKTSVFDLGPVKRSEARQALHDAVAGETLWKRVLFRFKIGRFAEEKYGLKRCVIACDSRDKFADKVADKKLVAKVTLIQRVIEPRSANLAIILQCLMDTSCKPNEVNTEDDTLHTAQNGEPTSTTDREIRTSMQSFADKYGTEKLAELVTKASDIEKAGGYQNYLAGKLADSLVGKLGGSEAAKETTKQVAGKAIPVIGWINLASQTIGSVGTAGPKLQKMSYVANAAAMAGVYQTYRTVADETKSGHMDATELGSFVAALGPGTQAGGKGSAAESTPLYHQLMGDGNSTTTTAALIDAIASPKAFAATTDPTQNTYPCDDTKPVPSGQKVCREESLLTQSGLQMVADVISKSPQMVVLMPIVNLWNTVWNHSIGLLIDAAGGLIGGVINSMPGISSLEEFAAKFITPFIQLLTQYIIPSPISPDMDGGRTFDMMAGGANVMGSDYPHNGLGGQLLTDAQVAEITNRQLGEAQTSFNHQSFFARMFSTDTPYSFISRLAMAMPNTVSGSASSVAGTVLQNPFASLGRGFAAFFSSPRAFAATTTKCSYFGVKCYGYPPGTIPDDPDAYWNANCTDDSKTLAWNDAAAANIDPDTQMPVNKDTNPCLLIAASVTAAGATSTDAVLSQDDLFSSTIGGTVGSPTAITGPLSTINQKSLYEDSTNIACAAGTNDLGLADGYHSNIKVRIRLCAVPGIPSSGEESHNGYGVTGANGNSVVNSRVSANFLAMAQDAAKAGKPLSATSSFRTMSHQQALCPCDGLNVAEPGTSNHQMGIAIDFALFHTKGGTDCSARGTSVNDPMWQWLNKNAAKYGIRQYAHESWHWDALADSTRCGGDGT